MPGFEAEIARIIQLAVAPVFLIAGIGGILSVLLNRLKLIYQRYRRFEQQFLEDPDRSPNSEEQNELHLLDRRMTLIHRSITLSTLAVLLVCLVIVALFTEEFIRVDVSGLVASLFVATMATLILALIFFLLEIRIATRMLRVRRDLLASR
ncbi:MAG: DUF2721 domain-containing protein [Pseudomonadota bacterium]